MPVLTDRQRLELAIPAYLLYALASAPDVFIPADPPLAAEAEADIAALQANLRTACHEPLDDLMPRKREAILRRLRRMAEDVMASWGERSKLGLMLMLWCFLKDLTDREVLILWQGSAMDCATRQLLPMFAYGFDEQKSAVAAEEQAGQLLGKLQAEGLYR